MVLTFLAFLVSHVSLSINYNTAANVLKRKIAHHTILIMRKLVNAHRAQLIALVASPLE
jgi:predicted metalloenzyme YecM